MNSNEDFVVDLTTHVINNSVQVEHLDVLAGTYAKRLIEYQQALLDCDYIGECIVPDPHETRYSSAFWNVVDLFVVAVDNEAVQNEDEAATKCHQAYTDFVKYITESRTKQRGLNYNNIFLQEGILHDTLSMFTVANFKREFDLAANKHWRDWDEFEIALNHSTQSGDVREEDVQSARDTLNTYSKT